jgi:hypothetical protein
MGNCINAQCSLPRALAVLAAARLHEARLRGLARQLRSRGLPPPDGSDDRLHDFADFSIFETRDKKIAPGPPENFDAAKNFGDAEVRIDKSLVNDEDERAWSYEYIPHRCRADPPILPSVYRTRRRRQCPQGGPVHQSGSYCPICDKDKPRAVVLSHPRWQPTD